MKKYFGCLIAALVGIGIVSDNIDNITVRFLNNSPRARMLSDDGNGIYMTYSMTTADPSMQYRFQW